MIKRINEMIDKYKTEDEDAFDGWDMNDMVDEILSDLRELEKLAEKKIESKLADLVNAQQPMPTEFKKVVDENFWELAGNKICE
jgi:hypothetical protein